MPEIQCSLLEYVKLSWLVNIAKSKVKMNTTLRGVPYNNAPEVERIAVDKLEFEQIYVRIIWSRSFLIKLSEENW